METTSISPAQFEVRFTPDSITAIQQATKGLHESLARARALGKPTLLLLSGGSALGLLSEPIDPDLLPTDLTLTVLDERFSRDPSVNNFLQVSDTQFYRDAEASGAKVIRTVPEKGQRWNELAKQYDRQIKTWLDKYPDGEVIATLGVGDKEGHTAGMFPGKRFQSQFMQDDTFVKGYIIPSSVNQYTTRMTATVALMKRINVGIALALGERKREILRQVREAKTSGEIEQLISQLPVASWRLTGNTQVFTDGVL